MGEKEFKTSPHQLKDLEERIEKISSKQHVINNFTQLKVLFLRRLVLMYKIPIQIAVIIFVMIFPGFVMMYVIENSQGSNLEINLIWREVSGAVFAITISLLCSTFVYLPCYERSNKLRYLLEKMGVSSLKYYSTLFASDLLIGFAMCCIGTIFIFSTFTESSGIESSGYYLEIVLSNLAWMATYITQSYIVSFMFKTIQGSSRIAPLIILLTNVVLPLAAEFDHVIVHTILFIVFPCPCFLAIHVNSISSKKTNFQMSVSMSPLRGYIYLVCSTICYFILAVYFDIL
jgi:ABC-type multidrug transport system ATPase subunit